MFCTIVAPKRMSSPAALRTRRPVTGTGDVRHRGRHGTTGCHVGEELVNVGQGASPFRFEVVKKYPPRGPMHQYRLATATTFTGHVRWSGVSTATR
jgi:hypothetical protein